MNVWPPRLGAGTVHHYTVKARVLRAEAFNAAFRRLFKILTSTAYTVAPLAFSRRRCSSSRGNISTKLQGR